MSNCPKDWNFCGTWRRWTWTPWEAITPSAKDEKLMFSPTTTLSMMHVSGPEYPVPSYLIKQSSSSAHDAGRECGDKSKFFPISASASIPSQDVSDHGFYEVLIVMMLLNMVIWNMISIKKSIHLIATTSACAVGSPFCTRMLWPWKTSQLLEY